MTREEGKDAKLSKADYESGGKSCFEVLLKPGSAADAKVVSVRLHGKECIVSRRALFILPITSPIRKALLWLVKWRWFDGFILLCIVFNSVLLATEKHRAGPEDPVNRFIDAADKVLTWIFITECVLKIFGLGFVLDKKTYLRDPWNILDFVVVMSAVVEMLPFFDLASVSFLRLFRVLRPLRSLNAIPEMKALVNTTLRSVPKLGNVAALGMFIGLVFAIVGVTLMPGIFYHRCRTTEAPELVTGVNNTLCWKWDFHEDAAGLCGGDYMCEDVEGFCSGHEFDSEYAPKFPNGEIGPAAGGHKWCPGSEPAKLNPETDFVHFDHLGGALLLIFQCTTMEGWTDIMYYVQDALKEYYYAWVYFILLIVVNAFFLLNVALAVVDEARDEFGEDEAKDEPSEDQKKKLLPDPDMIDDEPEEEIEYEYQPLWIDCWLVDICKKITLNEVFANFVTLIITGNVVCMMLDQHPPIVSIQDTKDTIARIFLCIFVVEMFFEIVGRGPKGYVMNPSTLFDGCVVIVSLIEEAIYLSGGKAGGLKALRTLRLFRVLNKFASRSPALKILLKSILETAKALRYWCVLFVLVLYICTLMWINFFKNSYHFNDTGDLDSTMMWGPTEEDASKAWCPQKASPFSNVRANRLHHHQDCIPRAHFDNFGWGFVTIFQIMSGENWNTVMYAGMRAAGWEFAILFMLLMLFGQILFLSLFLSMLLSKFDEFKGTLEEEHASKKSLLESKASSASLPTLASIKRSSLSFVGASPSTGSLADQADKQNAPGAVKVKKKTSKVAPESPEDADARDIIAPGGDVENTESHTEVEPIPGQPEMSEEGSRQASPAQQAPKEPEKVTNDHLSDDEEARPGKEGLQDNEPDELPDRNPCATWPKDYAWFILHKSNPIRRAANWWLNFQVTLPIFKDPEERPNGLSMLVFDNFILVCILVSTVCMMLDTPLADPESGLVQVIRGANTVFVYIFVLEMVVKLLAMPLFMSQPGSEAYLKDAWNWLDGSVVLVSIITIAVPKGPSFLRTLRILRAFRPLRVIKRLKTLKTVVETIFKSMKELGVLLVVFAIFLLIFALLFMMYLSGMFEQCSETNLVFLKDVNLGVVEGVAEVDFSLPLCFGSDFSQSSNARGSQALGQWSAVNDSWNTTGFSCPSEFPTEWKRASADTPICIARCDPGFDPESDMDKVGDMYTTICPRRYAIPEELPSRCDDPTRVKTQSELVGDAFVAGMQAWYTVPCAGSTAESAAAGQEAPMKALSCREVMCGDKVKDETREQCKAECRHPHPYLCANICPKDQPESPACMSCLEECQAACECDQFCKPLIKDAAMCHEQGAQWEPVLSQNFDNVWNSMLTLTEISTTEGWVDVMYAACDSTMNLYIQPVRDTSHVLWMVMFCIWIVLSFMFIMNVAVGVIVDKFMDERKDAAENENEDDFDEVQTGFLKTRKYVLEKKVIFDLYDIDQIPKRRRKVYNLISHGAFDAVIMSCILLNTLIMSLKVFPELETEETKWWRVLNEGLSLFFAFVFTVESVLKLYALRCNYWKEGWNIFDFSCVVATIGGLTLRYSNSGIDISSLASVVRIFRIARLFRLLKFKPLRPMNKLFSSLGISMVKLANVGVVAFLFLVLFSILGVNLFATCSQEEETLNSHGNFKNFWFAFLTLFRASTGEAWNSIMHDLSKDERDFFFEKRWCTPENLFDWQDKYAVLKEKCLIDRPNACVSDIGGWNPFPWLYWVSYTLFIGLVIMNIVVAVILEGYDESKSSDHAEIVEACKKIWGSKKYDPDHKMKMSMKKTLRFIFETIRSLQADKIVGGNRVADSCGNDLTKVPMKFALAMDLAGGGQVDFFSATRQVVRFCAILESEDDHRLVCSKLNAVEESNSKYAKVIKELEEKRGCMTPKKTQDFAVVEDIAARKMQSMMIARRKTEVQAEAEASASVTQSQADSPVQVDESTIDAPRIAG